MPERFFREVYRVLRPQGYFLLADFRDQPEIPLLHDQLRNANLTVLKEEFITPNIIRALELDHDRKIQLIRQNVPGILYTPFLSFAATKNSKTYKTFKSRETEYLNIILQKGI
jgi:ubiquinone/menaquinone biosynthesis C-methylase UbiE